MPNKLQPLKKQTFYLFSSFLIILFLTINSLSLFTPVSQSTQNILNSFLGSLNTLAQEVDTDQPNQLSASSGFNSPLLPNNTLPNYSINFNCNYTQKENGKEYRIIEFNYINRTGYRINLGRSTVRVGKLDIDPYSIRNEKRVKELSNNGISIIQTHFNSNLYVRELNGMFEHQRFDSLTSLDAANEVIRNNFGSNLTQLLPSNSDLESSNTNQTVASLFTRAYNNGPIDYLESGRKSAMSL